MGSVHAPAGRARDGGWTKQRMRESAPTPLLRVKPPQPSDRDEPPAKDSPRRGAIEPKSVASKAARYSGNPYATPLKWAGKLYYNRPGDGPGQGWNCSAQFIDSNILLTAAHCVRDEGTGQFFKNFKFALQYKEGEYSHLYGWKCAATKNGWVQSSNDRYKWDYAMILTDQASQTGWFGTKWNWWDEYKTATRVGYPRGDLRGLVMQVDQGDVSLDNQSIVKLKHQNPADQLGSSGGAWVGGFGTVAQNNYVISVSSYVYDGVAFQQFGPYFTPEFKELMDYTKRGCR
jgi:hypothetical protein